MQHVLAGFVIFIQFLSQIFKPWSNSRHFIWMKTNIPSNFLSDYLKVEHINVFHKHFFVILVETVFTFL